MDPSPSFMFVIIMGGLELSFWSDEWLFVDIWVVELFPEVVGLFTGVVALFSEAVRSFPGGEGWLLGVTRAFLVGNG